MKNLGEEIRSFIPKGFAERQAAVIQKMEQHQEVQRLKEMFPNRTGRLTHPTNYSAISGHLTSFDHCKSCRSLASCKNDQMGHCSVAVPHPDKESELVFRLRKCPLMIADEKRRKTSDKIKSHYIPEDVINATFDYIETDPHRATAIMAAMKFCDEFEVGSSKRGLYLYGNFGVGKSLITGAIAQELASRGIDVAMVYVPDFLSEVKDAIDSKTDTVNAKLEALRNVTVLILDDIGAESHSAWTRDEVLGSILQRRMNRLVTIYTSNLTIRELRQHLLNVKKANPGDQKMHEKKVERIMERIEPFVEVVHVGGRNRRREG